PARPEGAAAAAAGRRSRLRPDLITRASRTTPGGRVNRMINRTDGTQQRQRQWAGALGELSAHQPSPPQTVDGRASAALLGSRAALLAHRHRRLRAGAEARERLRAQEFLMGS